MKKNNDVMVKVKPVRKKRGERAEDEVLRPQLPIKKAIADEVLQLQVPIRKTIKHETAYVQMPIVTSPIQHDFVFKNEVIEVKESSYERYLKDMQKYIDTLKKMDQKDAEKISRESLIRTGVLDHKGKQKEQICTGGMYVGRH